MCPTVVAVTVSSCHLIMVICGPVAVDPDHVSDGCRVHDVMVTDCQVSPHHRDPVTAGLARAAGGQQPQFPCALHGRGAVTDLELGVDAADVRADRARRDG